MPKADVVPTIDNIGRRFATRRPTLSPAGTLVTVSAVSPPRPARSSRTLRIALVGNPNTGKSTLFNALAGMHVRTGNYPGVTIERKVGRCRIGPAPFDLIDLPGTYSLAPRSPDELVAVQVLTDGRVDEPPIDGVVCVVNAGVLERNLFLVSQVLELGKPVVIALNMIDAAQARGITIDVESLSERLGVPVVATAATRRQGLQELTAAVVRAVETHRDAPPARSRPLPDAFYQTCDRLRGRLIAEDPATANDPTAPETEPSEAAAEPPEAEIRAKATGTGNVRETDESARSAASVAGAVGGPPAPDRYLIERMLLDRGGEAERQAERKYGPGSIEVLQDLRRELAETLGDPADMECSARYRWAAEMLEGVLHRRDGSGGATDWLDAILTHRVIGVVLFVSLMLSIFQAIYTFAGIPMGWIEAGTGAAADGIRAVIAPGMLRSLLVDGVIAGVGGVIIFLPQIALLFLFIAILEDCGYMSRAAFLVDRVMTMFGLSGKSFLPLMSSFACAVPGIMATRVIENRRDRFATILVAPLMSCSARLPVYLLLIGAFIPATTVLGFIALPAVVLMSMYLVGVVVAIPISWLLKRTLLRGETAPFVLELPEYKIPSARVVLSRVWEACREFMIRAGTLIFAASVLIWFAGYWPSDHGRQHELQARVEAAGESDPELEAMRSELKNESARLLEESLLGRIGHAIEPAVRPLGWDWKIGVGAIASFPAREVIIATLGTIYSLGGDVDEADEGLIGALRSATWPDGRPVFTVPVALSVMVFFALCAQCASTLFIIKRETNSWFWPVLSFTYMTVLAYLAAMVTYQVGSRWFA